jgi:hypothetical protein
MSPSWCSEIYLPSRAKPEEREEDGGRKEGWRGERRKESWRDPGPHRRREERKKERKEGRKEGRKERTKVEE